MITGMTAPIWAVAVNYDEAKVGNLPLPDALRMEDGQSVKNAAMWYRLRRFTANRWTIPLRNAFAWSARIAPL
jgi:hypothetical protein